MDDAEFFTTIKRLRTQGRDDATVEVKSSASKLSTDIWESVSAFANTEGGVILLGLNENNSFLPVENFQIDTVRDQFISGMGDGGSEGRLTNPPNYNITRHDLDGQPVLEITIHELEAPLKPCFITKRNIQGGSFKRVDDADIHLSTNEVFSLQNAYRATTTDRDPVPHAELSDLDSAIYLQTFAKAQQVNPRALKNADSTEVKLKRLNFTDSEGHVTKAGLLVGGCYPQQFFPKLLVDVAVHAGTEKSIPGEPRFLDRIICEGTIGEMIDSAVSAVARNLKTASFVLGSSRIDELELPIEVLREAIANALIHREYDARFDGESVAVDVYSDRVEILNPGSLWNKSRQNLTDGRSCCRNATLMKLMSIAPLPNGAGSPAEGNGSGIQLMIHECEKRGLKAPVFAPEMDHFKVILFRPSNGTSKPPLKERATSNETAIIRLLQQNESLSIREIADMSNLTVSQVRYRIGLLMESGEVEPTASTTSRNRKYKLRPLPQPSA